MEPHLALRVGDGGSALACANPSFDSCLDGGPVGYADKVSAANGKACCHRGTGKPEPRERQHVDDGFAAGHRHHNSYGPLVLTEQAQSAEPLAYRWIIQDPRIGEVSRPFDIGEMHIKVLATMPPDAHHRVRREGLEDEDLLVVQGSQDQLEIPVR